MLLTYWNIGKRIVEQELGGSERAEYNEEMNQKTAELQKNQFELIKSLVIAEFLGFKNEDTYLEVVCYSFTYYVLVDLKMGRINHQDVGQIDMYVRMYDDLKRGQGDNTTVSLCWLIFLRVSIQEMTVKR